jgi:hypothetical protein
MVLLRRDNIQYHELCSTARDIKLTALTQCNPDRRSHKKHKTYNNLLRNGDRRQRFKDVYEARPCYF